MTAGPRIRLLEQPVADAIAAGEVVERPASVIKELCENALDAGASRIDVDIDGGGITRMRVTDNGGGIAPDDLPMAVARHATSKIVFADDLRRIETLGFRGEALASIAAVSELTMTSRLPNDAGGFRVRVRGGVTTDSGPAAGAPGTTVEVCDLFVTTPARLRFLRSPRTEAGAATRVIADLALSHPEVAFTARVDGRVAIRTPGGRLRDALHAVFGAKAAADLIEVDVQGPVTVGGAISQPRAHRATRNQVVLMVNARRIHSRSITVAVEDAYRALLPGGRFPFGVVTVALDPGEVDVNVHPAKREVRFRDERSVFSAVQRACWHALQGSQPYQVAPGWNAAGGTTLRPRHLPGGGDPGGTRLLPWPGQEVRDGDLPATSPEPGAADGWGERPDGPSPPPAGNVEGFRAPGTHAGGAPVSGPIDAGRDPEDPTVQPPGRLPAMRAIGQVGTAWLVAEADGGVVLVDPHAAHEKVLYAELVERWRAAPLGDGTSQLLLLPAVIECDPRQMASALAAGDFLTRCGFVLEPFGPGTLRCSAVPSVAAAADVHRLVADLLDQIDDEHGPADQRQHRIAALVACHAAVRFGTTVAAVEQQRLLDRLIITPGALTCPHGRPTTLILDDLTLRRAFRRPVT